MKKGSLKYPDRDFLNRKEKDPNVVCDQYHMRGKWIKEEEPKQSAEEIFEIIERFLEDNDIGLMVLPRELIAELANKLEEHQIEMIYPIVVYGHPVLRKISREIDKDYPGLEQFIEDLFESMYHSEGLGLAAPQVGKSIRIFVIDGKPAAEDEPLLADFKRTFINAHIIEKTGELMLMNEGCLSIPNLREEVNRESHIRITYYDENWQYHDEVYDGYKARIIQHEYDHLDGIMFTDKISPLRKRLIKSKLTAISKGRFEAEYKTILPGQKLKSP